MLVALRNAAFRKVAAVYTLNTLIEWFAAVALMVLVYGATGSPIATAALLLCKQVVPGVLVGFAGGAIARLPVGRALWLACVLQAVALAGIGALGYGLWLYPLAALAGAGSAGARAALRGTVASVLPSGELRGGNAVLNLALGIAGPAGPAVAAAAVAATTAPTTLVGGALALLVLAALGSTVRVRVTESAEAPASGAGHDESKADSLPLGWLLLLGGLATSLSVVDEPSLLAFTQELGGDVAAYGGLFTAGAIGAAVGTVLFTRLLHLPMLRIYLIATALFGLGLLGMGVAPAIEVALACSFVAGVGTGMDWVAIVTAAQEATPRGREVQVAARLEAFATVGPALGIGLGGLIAELGSPRLALLAPAVIALVVVVSLTAYTRLRGRAAVGTSPYFAPPIPGGTA